MSEQANDGVREVVALLGELLDGPSSGEFYGIGPVLRNKLETIRLTALRRPSPVGTEDIVEVVQADRDIVAREVEGDSDNPLRVAEANAIYDGKRDDSEAVQRAARHRLESSQSIAPRTAIDAVAVGETVPDQIERVMSSKWLDPECGEDGCQSLKWKRLYEQAVKGRQDFRQALRESRAETRTEGAGE